MRKVFSLFCFYLLTQINLFSNNIGYYKENINDFAHIINNEYKEKLEKAIKYLEKKEKIRIFIITVSSIKKHTKNAVSLDKFLQNVLNKIEKKYKNKSIILLISIKDRKLKIETGTYYGDKFDKIMDKIIQTKIIPYFKIEKYSEGIYNGVYYIIKQIEEYKLKKNKRKQFVIKVLLFTFFIFVGIFIMHKVKLLILSKKVDDVSLSFGDGASGEW